MGKSDHNLNAQTCENLDYSTVAFNTPLSTALANYTAVLKADATITLTPANVVAATASSDEAYFELQDGRRVPVKITVTRRAQSGGSIIINTTGGVFKGAGDGNLDVEVIFPNDCFGNEASFEVALLASSILSSERLTFYDENPVTGYIQGAGGSPNITATLPYVGFWNNNNNNAFSAFSFDATNKLRFGMDGNAGAGGAARLFLLNQPDLREYSPCEMLCEIGERIKKTINTQCFEELGNNSLEDVGTTGVGVNSGQNNLRFVAPFSGEVSQFRFNILNQSPTPFDLQITVQGQAVTRTVPSGLNEVVYDYTPFDVLEGQVVIIDPLNNRSIFFRTSDVLVSDIQIQAAPNTGVQGASNISKKWSLQELENGDFITIEPDGVVSQGNNIPATATECVDGIIAADKATCFVQDREQPLVDVFPTLPLGNTPTPFGVAGMLIPNSGVDEPYPLSGGQSATVPVTISGENGTRICGELEIQHVSGTGLGRVTVVSDGRMIQLDGGDYILNITLPSHLGQDYVPRWWMGAASVGPGEALVFQASNPVTEFNQGAEGQNIGGSLPYVGAWNNNNNNAPSYFGFDASPSFTVRINGQDNVSKSIAIGVRDIPVFVEKEVCTYIDEVSKYVSEVEVNANIVDESTPNVTIIGNTAIQRGIQVMTNTVEAVVFPVPFANNGYSFNATVRSNSSEYTNQTDLGKTNLQTEVGGYNANGVSTPVTFEWIAIGEI